MTGPLDGVKVVEFTEIIAGPVSGVMLSDLGADVIKVEPPWGDPWRDGGGPFAKNESRAFIAVNRGKRSIQLDLTKDDGREAAHRLVRNADIVITNHRPDVPAKLGIDYETLSAINPGIIYAEASAYGLKGPYAGGPGYDVLAQGFSGIIASEGIMWRGVPRMFRTTPFVDFATGYSIVQSVCAALYFREKSGRGQKIGTSLLANALTTLSGHLARIPGNPTKPQQWYDEDLPLLQGSGLSYSEINDLYYEARWFPSAMLIYYRPYQTADGLITVACLSEPLRKRMADCVGFEDRRFRPGYDLEAPESIEFADDLLIKVEELIAEKTAEEWLRLFHEAGVPAMPVLFLEGMLDNEQAQANDLVIEQEHHAAGVMQLVGPSVNFSDTTLEAVRPSPALGGHTAEILAEAGYTAAEIATLLESGAALG
ncbi:MAG: CoA transferase [Dehalococcoidia bacterium]|jgi:formyl-CoA transferase|nr:CoA transferase [Dehalococcoidia bacterium]